MEIARHYDMLGELQLIAKEHLWAKHLYWQPYLCWWHINCNPPQTCVAQGVCLHTKMALWLQSNKITCNRIWQGYMSWWWDDIKGICNTSAERWYIWVCYWPMIKRNMEVDFVKQRTDKARKTFFAVESIGSRAYPASPLVKSKLYWSKCMTRMIHGLEILPLSNPSVAMMAKWHGAMAKLVHGQSKQTTNVTPTATLGWHSLECHITLITMLFLWQIQVLPMNNI